MFSFFYCPLILKMLFSLLLTLFIYYNPLFYLLIHILVTMALMRFGFIVTREILEYNCLSYMLDSLLFEVR